jgi:hypothetical protein
VQDAYHDVPYHNAVHGCDVMHACYWMLCHAELDEVLGMQRHEIFAMVVGGMVHDVEHPGTNNIFHQNTRSKFAVRYNDVSVLENHHASAAFSLMLAPDHNVFGKLSDGDFAEARRIVLATDMANHFTHLGQLQTRNTTENLHSFKDESDRMLVLECTMHAADLSNPAKPLITYLVWAERICLEFFAQGDQEKRLGVPVGLLNDRVSLNIAKSQIGFFNIIVAPFLTTFASVFVENGVDPSVAETWGGNLEDNRAFWEERVEKMATEQERGTQQIPYPKEPEYGRPTNTEFSAIPWGGLTKSNDDRFSSGD